MTDKCPGSLNRGIVREDKTLNCIKSFLKKEIVLAVSLVLAASSMFLVPPDSLYAGYIDWDVLMLLFSLMAVVASFKGCGVFGAVSGAVMKIAGNARRLALLLTLACFFFSMAVTNDVALITFVPLTVGMLASAPTNTLIYVISLETVAANLGSMATPIGNPQNLYLYSAYGMGFGEFAGAVLPLAGLSLLMLAAACMPVKKQPVAARDGGGAAGPAWKLVSDVLLLAVCLLSVFRVLPKYACCIAVGLCMLIIDRRALASVDYALLGTFACFFVFVGNISRIDAVSAFVERAIAGRELAAGVIASQVISNVPAALMLSGFTENGVALMRGVNIGGLGTIIASLASLISFKAYMQSPGAKAGKYIGCFTVMNAAFLAILCLAAMVI